MPSKPQEFWKLVLKYASRPPGNSSSTLRLWNPHPGKFLRQSFRDCWLLDYVLETQAQVNIRPNIRKSLLILEVMICKRRKTSLLCQHSAMNYNGKEANQGHAVAEWKKFHLKTFTVHRDQNVTLMYYYDANALLKNPSRIYLFF